MEAIAVKISVQIIENGISEVENSSIKALIRSS